MSFSSQTLRSGVVFKRKDDPTSGRKVRFLNSLIALSGHADPLVADQGLDSGKAHSGLAGSWGLLLKHLLGIKHIFFLGQNVRQLRATGFDMISTNL